MHDRLGKPLIVSDDDITGTFTFVRAVIEAGFPEAITPQMVAENWLNHIIENKTILWWGGLGRSTEHTAFARMKAGIPAPQCGSIETNGAIIAEQIGAQIFIDAWAMLFPGEPDKAANFAEAAARVSHDGAAVDAAKLIAAMESAAFVESDLNTLLDTGLKFVPSDGIIATMIADIRAWHASGIDWRTAFFKLRERYGYDKFGGNCHVVPNHGLIILAMLFGEGNFQRSLMIVNTCGWDTDCNSGNLGCLLGIRGGLATIDDGPDWRGPINDRMFLPTAAPGLCINDATRVTDMILRCARGIRGLAEPEKPRYHFCSPGSTHGAIVEGGSIESGNEFAVKFDHLANGRRLKITIPTFASQAELKMEGYSIIGSPSVYSGQALRVAADLSSSVDQLHGRLIVMTATRTIPCQEWLLLCNGDMDLTAVIPEAGIEPIEAIGFELISDVRADGRVQIDFIDVNGLPTGPLPNGRAWITDSNEFWMHERGGAIVSNSGVRIAATGDTDGRANVEAILKADLAKSIGVVAGVQGLRRYISLSLSGDGLTLAEFGGREVHSSEVRLESAMEYTMKLCYDGQSIVGTVGNVTLTLDNPRFETGGVGVLVEDGFCEIKSAKFA